MKLAFFIVVALFMASLISPNLVQAAQGSRPYQYISWTFYVYGEPNFRAERVATFNPQRVYTVYTNGDGWALIYTLYGEMWVYRHSDLRFVSRRMGVFESKGDTRHISYISPQVVSVLEQDGRWLQISTWLGDKWIYLDFAPSITSLDALITRHGSDLSVFYKNIETGFTYTHNASRIFFGASLTKANHALYVYTLAERGIIDLDSIHTFATSDRRGGTGRIQHMPIGTQFTTRELLYHSIVYSCNVAFGMLARYAADAELSYHYFALELGARYFRGNVASHLNANARDTALWMYAIYNYLESESQFGHYFREDLTSTPGFIMADHPMARKYGWAVASFHDAAIVYAPSPYILVLMSNIDEGAFTLFANISLYIQGFNSMWFE